MERPATIGRYRVLDEVGRGGMGVVYRAQASDGRVVAVKLLLAGKSASELQRRRVATEIQALLRLRHPNVVELLDAGEHEGVPYLVMEWIEGQTLSALLHREGPLEPVAAVELVRVLCSALRHCHVQGVLHRDLKPDNVLLRRSDGAALLLDFGLSKDMASDSSASTVARTVRGRWLGTPGYWPPEQARGDLDAIGPRSDVYGLGGVLYAALTGRSPQQGSSLLELLAAVERPVVPPSHWRRGLPAWLDTVVTRTLSCAAEERHAGPEELGRDLDSVRERLLTPAPPASSSITAPTPAPEQGPRSARVPRLGSPALPGRVLLLGASLLTLATVCAAGLAVRSSGPPPTPSSDEMERRPQGGEPGRARHTTRRQMVTALGRDDPRALPAAAALFHCGLANTALHQDQQAIWSFDLAIALDPRNAVAHLSRGSARARLGLFWEAIADYDQAITLAPRSAHAYYGRGVARSRLAQHREAIRDYDQAIALDPRMALVYYSRGVSRSHLGHWTHVLSDFGQAVALDPLNSRAFHNRAVAHSNLREYSAAIADCDRAISLDPRNAAAYSNRGFAYASLGRHQEALKDLDRSITLDPRSGQAHHNRGMVHAQLGQHPEAIADFDRALELDPAATWARNAHRLRASSEALVRRR